ncbi:MAG: alpha/beta hydrolase [Leifsonia sp.]
MSAPESSEPGSASVGARVRGTSRNAGAHRVLVVLGWIAGVIIAVAIVFLVWTQIVMQGERPAALAVWENDAVSVTSTDHSVVLSPTGEANGTGLVFIPGAKVDPYAYMYKLSGIVEGGTTVVITKPTLNLAFFDTRPLSAFTADAPGVTTWYVGGHSLGGVRACMLADDPAVTGLILFGSYCANDISASDLAVLSLGGETDALSTPDKIADAAPLLPSDAAFVEIGGANHASFGDYGVQPGDGEATASSEDVRAEITTRIDDFLG